ncbi:transporter substrate-binding domain-containing protein [Ruminococcaceae bacterium OttesenSCG-928-A11]|nr:transporter substrate-binding domain-containing protein [Ruminococcaceae bacterium OttesenSCG-928-A11]
MKKILAVLMCAVLALGIVGCGGAGGDGKTISSAADLAGCKIAVQEGTTGDFYVTDEVENSEVARFKKPTDAVMELINGRVDAVVIDELPAKRLVEANEGKVKILDDILTTEEYAIAVNKGQSDLLAEIDAAINQLHADGTYDILFDIFITGEDKELPPVPDYTPDGQIIMGTNAEFEPFEYYDDSNQLTGLDVWMAKHVAAIMGKELVVEDMAFDALIAALNTGKVDFVAAALTNNEERRQNVDFTQDYFTSSQVIIVVA